VRIALARAKRSTRAGTEAPGSPPIPVKRLLNDRASAQGQLILIQRNSVGEGTLPPNSIIPAASLARPAGVDVLLVVTDPSTTFRRDEVLRHAGFQVTVMSAAQTSLIADGAFAQFSVVVLCDTIAPEDLFIISGRVRRNSPVAKIVLIEDADCFDFDPSLSDATLDGVDCPVALMNAVKKLTGDPFIANGKPTRVL
jgi:hypothetical protein